MIMNSVVVVEPCGRDVQYRRRGSRQSSSVAAARSTVDRVVVYQAAYSTAERVLKSLQLVRG